MVGSPRLVLSPQTTDLSPHAPVGCISIGWDFHLFVQNSGKASQLVEQLVHRHTLRSGLPEITDLLQ